MTQPTALIACEYSGRVRDALTAIGFYAVSCDLLPSESEGEHIQ
ncbi:DNA cytosine methyltransferase, partial [Pseudomonas sp. CrR25]|nr:DNA cytosine methyltransferase [Pseudomonas sp. CrR25]